MQKFTRWVVTVACHYWFVLGGTTLGVIGLIVQQYAPNGRLEPWPFYVLCGLTFIGATFLAWRDEHDEAEKARSEYAALKSTRLTEEWNRAIETFRGLVDQEIAANLNEYTTGKMEWSLFGGSNPHIRACETACALGGHALAQSKCAKELPSEIADESDHFARWLSFVAMKDGFDGISGNGRDNTVDPPLVWESRSVRYIALASKRLCDDCLSREAFL
ncbi:MAG TPA: hypothetical protein VGJ78_01955 [Vicinamibacterales bacterium]